MNENEFLIKIYQRSPDEIIEIMKMEKFMEIQHRNNFRFIKSITFTTTHFFAYSNKLARKIIEMCEIQLKSQEEQVFTDIAVFMLELQMMEFLFKLMVMFSFEKINAGESYIRYQKLWSEVADNALTFNTKLHEIVKGLQEYNDFFNRFFYFEANDIRPINNQEEFMTTYLRYV